MRKEQLVIKEKNINEFFYNGTLLYIPFYQRNYDWDETNVKDLVTDLNSFIQRDESGAYFLGTIVMKNQNGKNNVVDGQQRITTLILFYSALMDLLKERSDLSEAEFNINGLQYNRMIEDIMVKVFYSNASGQMSKTRRLNLSNIKGESYLEWTITGDKPNEEGIDGRVLRESAFFKNKKILFNYLNEKIKTPLDFSKWLNLQNEIKFSLIELSNSDREHEIFENLNSKGKSLTELDLVKNYIYSHMEKYDMNNERFESVAKFFDVEIENVDKDFKKKFIRHYIAYKTGNLLRNKREIIYSAFKDLVGDFESSEKLWEVILEFKKLIIYYKYFDSYKFEKGIDGDDYELLMTLLRAKNTDVFFALLSQAGDKYLKITENDNIKITSEFKEIILILEKKDLFDVISKGTSERSGVRSFPKFIYNLKMKNSNWDIISFREAVLGDEANRQKTLNQFIYNIENLNIYEVSNIFSKHLLWRYNRKIEDKNLSKEFISINKYERYTIEHIIPQNPSKFWIEEIVNYDERVRTKLEAEDFINLNKHKLSNLTLTQDNSKLSNKSFIEWKKDIMKDSNLKMNQEIYEFEHWNSSSLEKRFKKLSDVFKEIYK